MARRGMVWYGMADVGLRYLPGTDVHPGMSGIAPTTRTLIPIVVISDRIIGIRLAKSQEKGIGSGNADAEH